MPTKTDVLIAGAGPVGLAMASELARYGLTVRIIDKSAARTDKSKALVVWPRTMELMDRMGCTDKFLAAGLHAGAVRILSGRETIANVDMTTVDSPYPFALMIPQSDTERVFEEHLATYGAKVERSTTLKDFADHGDSVSYTLVKPDGTEETGEASWLIGCDGAHSTVRHALGMEFHGETLPANFALADVQLSGITGPITTDIYWHSDGVLALFPMPRGRFRVIADVGDATPAEAATGTPHRPDPTLQDIQKIIDTRMDPASSPAIRPGSQISPSTNEKFWTTARAASFWPETPRTSTVPLAGRA